MSPRFTKEQMAPMIMFVNLLKHQPALLHTPELAFLKSFVEHFGGKIPAAETPPQAEQKATEETSQETEDIEEPKVESEESDIELDMTDVIEPDNDPPQEMGDPELVPSEEQVTESQAKRSEAVSAFVEKDYEKALALYTEAITLNPQVALLYAKRGQIYLLTGKPNACIRDCDRALELNPDSAAGHKFRGRANQLLGRFEEAAVDLRLACKFDFDEQTDEWLREVTPNAQKIEEHKRKKERKLSEKVARERATASKKAGATKTDGADGTRGPQTEGSDAGDGGARESEQVGEYLQEMLQAFQDPEVSQAFLDITSNPGNMYKYENNPRVMKLLQKTFSKFGPDGKMGGGMPGFPGMMGGMPGGMPGFFPGAGPMPNEPNTGAPKPSAPDDDVGLD